MKADQGDPSIKKTQHEGLFPRNHTRETTFLWICSSVGFLKSGQATGRADHD